VAEIEIRGMKEALAKLDRATSDAVIGRIIFSGLVHLNERAMSYPPSTEANQPRGFNSMYSIRTHRPMNTWYQRGYGSKWVRKDGSVKGRQSSEQLQQSWTARMRGKYTGVLGNDTTYGPYVQDEKKQARFHRARGWKTIQDITVLQFAKAEIDRALAR